MADFIADKAVEEQAEQAEEEEVDDGLPVDEPEMSDSGDSSGSSDDEDEGDEEDAKFLADEAEEDDEEEKEGAAEQEDGEGEPTKKKKRRRRELVLEEDDYALLEENTGVRQVRPQGHRRLKKARDVTTTGGGGLGADEERRDTAAALREELFGNEGEIGLEDDIEDDDDAAVPTSQLYENGGGGGRDSAAGQYREDGGGGGGGDMNGDIDRDEFLESDEDDWIVNEFDEEDNEEGGGGGGGGGRRPRRRKPSAGDPLYGIDLNALAEANEIFGDVDDLMEMYTASKAKAGGGGGGEDGGDDGNEEEEDKMDDVDLEGLSDGEVDEIRRARREDRRTEAAARRLQQQLEPGAMERYFMLPEDDRIREVDVPEREQLRRGMEPAEFDIEACAEWIVRELAQEEPKAQEILEDGVREVEGPPPDWMGVSTWKPINDEGHAIPLLRNGIEDISSTRAIFVGRASSSDRKEWRSNNEAQAALRASIRTALSLMYESHEEVPILGMYRKELMGELLCLRSNDEPESTAAEFLPGGYENPAYGTIRAKDRRARRWDILWAVLHLSQKWRALQRMKEIRRDAFENALITAATEEESSAIQACLEALAVVNTMEALHDVDLKFQLVAPQPEDAVAALELDEDGEQQQNGGSNSSRQQQQQNGGGALRRRRRATAHQLGLRAGLREAANAFGLSAAQFAENIEAGYQRHVPTDSFSTPAELAAQYVDPDHPTRRDAEMVMRSAALILATEIAAEPAVRKAVRDYFWANATLSTSVTPAGIATLTPFHPLGITKRLKGKDLRSMGGKSDTYLRVSEAEKAGYVTVSIDVDENSAEILPQDTFLSGGVGPEARAWNDVRIKILQDAISNLLLPEIKKEARARLAADSKVAASQEIARKMWELAIEPPVALEINTDEGHFEGSFEKRIMAVSWGSSAATPTTFVIIDSHGIMVDFLHCPQLSGPIPRTRPEFQQPYSVFTDRKKQKDVTALRHFIEAHLPHAIIVGVGHSEALVLQENIKAVLDKILDDNGRLTNTMETGGISQIPMPETVAALWELSTAAKEELPTSAPIVRKAVALARQALDPLAVLASLCGPSKEVLSIPLHPVQTSLSDEERMRTVEEIMTSVVAQVGVDINAAAAHAWRAAPLAFVPGLGPRKSQALLRAIARSGGFVESRKQVLKELGVLGSGVYRNAAPFVRVRASSKAAANVELDLLDDTRVHPESYILAEQLAASAVPGVDADVVVEHAMANPHEVEALDLDVYDRHLLAQDQEAAADDVDEEGEPQLAGPEVLRGHTRLSTLVDIQMELTAPYGDIRPSWDSTRDLDAEFRQAEGLELALWKDPQLFYLAAGEGKDTLKPGRKVEAQVRHLSKEMVRVVIPELNNLEGVIASRDVSSKSAEIGEELDCRDYFKRDATLVAVILRILPDQRLIELGTSSAALNEEREWEKKYLAGKDDAFQVPTEKEMKAEHLESRRRAKPVKGVRRAIKHPLFKNLSMVDTVTALLAFDGGPEGGPVPVGTAVVRPGKSSKGLYLTVRLPSDLVWHMPIKELGVSTADLRLAAPISVEPLPNNIQEFDDLDEFAARFVDPLAGALRALCLNRKWRNGSWDEIKQSLIDEKLTLPSLIPYCLAADVQKPGAFYIASVVSDTPRREFFVVLPEGFYFRKKVHSTVDKLINVFKKNPRPQGAPAAAAATRGVALQSNRYAAAAAAALPPPQQQQQHYQEQYNYYSAPPVVQQQQQQQQYQEYPNTWYDNGGDAFGATVEDPYAQQAQYQQQYQQQQVQQQQYPPQQYPPQYDAYGQPLPAAQARGVSDYQQQRR